MNLSVTDYSYDSLDRATDVRYPAEYGNGDALFIITNTTGLNSALYDFPVSRTMNVRKWGGRGRTHHVDTHRRAS
jgi:hypothetical protein